MTSSILNLFVPRVEIPSGEAQIYYLQKLAALMSEEMPTYDTNPKDNSAYFSSRELKDK